MHDRANNILWGLKHGNGTEELCSNWFIEACEMAIIIAWIKMTVDPQFYIEHRSGTGNISIIQNYANAFNVYYISLIIYII